MCEWISDEGMDVRIEPSEEWKNLPVDPITATGGSSKEWETDGQRLLQEFAEQDARTAVGLIPVFSNFLFALIVQLMIHNLALSYPGSAFLSTEHVRPTVPLYRNCVRIGNSCDCCRDQEARCDRFGAIPRRTLFGTIQDESSPWNSNRGRFFI